MTITDYQSFVAYFTALTTAHVGVKRYYHGSIDRVSEAMRSDIEYYAVHTEFPDIDPPENLENTIEQWTTGLSVFGQCERDDHEAEAVVLQETLDILRDLLGRMRDDMHQGDIDFELIGTFGVVAPSFSDYVTGWRAELRFRASVCYDYDPTDTTKWQ